MTMTRGQIALLAGLTALAPLAIDMYLPALPSLATDLAVTVESAGQSVSVFLLGIAAGQLVAGPLSDRLGRRPLILAGLTVFLLSATIAALTSSFAVLLGARLMQALGACAAMVSVRAVVRDRFDATESARFFSLLALVGGLAPVIAPILGALLVRIGDWRLIFWAMVAVAAVLLVAGLVGLPESRSGATRQQAEDETPLAAFATLLGNRRLVGPLLATVCNSGAFFTYVANASVVFIDGYGLSPTRFSLWFAVNSAALVGAAQINRLLLRRRSAEDLLRVSGRNALLLSLPLAVFALSQWGGLWVFGALMFLAVGSFSPIQANAMAVGLSADPLRAGSCAALLGAAGFAGGACASWIAGWLYDGTSFGLALVAAVCMAGTGLSLLLRHRPENEARACRSR